RRLKNCSAIAGWGVMNEPYPGFIGHQNLETPGSPVMPMGPKPSPWDSIRAASGRAIEVPVYKAGSPGKPGREVFNPKGLALFREGFSCPWKQSGVWTDDGDEPRLLRRDHFANFEGRPTNFMRDFHRPFLLDFIQAQREVNENAFFFIEGTPPGSKAEQHPEWDKSELEKGANPEVADANIVNAFHWYDGFSLFMKRFNHRFTIDHGRFRLILGQKNVQAFFDSCLAKGVKWAREHMGNAPSLLGEFGLAFDMNKRRAFSTGDYSMHEKALSMYFNAVDANLLHSTLWNYTADNTNAHGDGWNDEDLSIFSDGAERAVAGWKRPYPMATAGEPVSIKWDSGKGVFRYRFKADAGIAEPTVIYLPAERFGAGTKVDTGLRFELRLEEQRALVFNDGRTGEVEVFVIGG
ncbi:MAG: cellulase family glycosylhydrolase, partial [Treponema sp.]|nr:cellulase family glycosylhydrolase [Treponema sp.]